MQVEQAPGKFFDLANQTSSKFLPPLYIDQFFSFRNIPLALMASFGMTIILYVATASAFVSIVPWYEVDVYAPFLSVYTSVGWHWARYVISLGITVGAVTSFIGAALSIPRYLFAMARDGLLMGWFSKVNEKTKVSLQT